MYLDSYPHAVELKDREDKAREGRRDRERETVVMDDIYFTYMVYMLPFVEALFCVQ